MNKKLLLLLFAFSANFITAQEIIQKGDVYYLSNTLIVKFKEGASPQTSAQSLQKKGFAPFTVTEATKLFPEEIALRKGTNSLGNIYLLKYSSTEDPVELAKKFSKNKDVEYAEPKYVHRVTVVPNDSIFLTGQQINLSRISATQAWDVTKGDSSVLIAIVDTGVDWAHPDLAANILRDNTGKVIGKDFGGLNGTEDDDPSEDKSPDGKLAYHGTHVAGIAAAVSDNKIGIASIGYNCTILPVKTSRSDRRDANGYPYVYYGFEGIKYAADKGAKVINCSWGSSSFSRYEQEVIDYAVSKGSLVVASAGNENTKAPFYPASYKGVLSVVWGLNDDRRYTGATYGINTDVLSLGSEILSTYPTYTSLSYRQMNGSSMAAPLVAGVAGLVASKFPNYSALQIGEQIRVTTDDIYSNGVNPDSIKYLAGKGRANAYRAVSEKNAVSVRATDVRFTETAGSNFNGLFETNETVIGTVSLTNYLSPISSVSIGVECSDNAVALIAPTKPSENAGAFNTLEQKSDIFNFYFIVLPSAPYNHEVNFLIKFSGGSYNDYQWISVRVNPTYDTHNANKIVMSVTSKGSLGFNDYPTNTDGQGFRYDNGDNLMFEGAFMYGTSETTVMDAARGIQVQSKDFQMVTPIKLTTAQNGDQSSATTFNDSGAGNSALGIETKQSSYAFANSPNDKYVIVVSDLYNKTQSEINNLYVGYFFDWDMPADDPVKDSTAFDAEENLGYAFYKDKNVLGTYTGAALISEQNYGYYPINNAATSGDVRLFDADEFSEKEKWTALSSGIVKQNIGYVDASFVASGGPYKLGANQSLRVAYAIAAADNLGELRNVIKQSRAQYKTIVGIDKQEDKIPTEFSLSQNYPNPFNPETTISYTIPSNVKGETAKVILKVYDVLGREVATLVDEFKQPGVYNSQFPIQNSQFSSGIYFYRLQAGDPSAGSGQSFVQTKKMILLK
ncbi:MAG: peptidase S8/S53 subtilisin kexin sedolisin [Stygiobacter sp.]|nr:MAG: peptidase S8/S53 subtilisin kexin sedolisin [Stygiobacter sp.]KAF0217162.1 MAG: peptidase S8/S53 subtilisin kexin [Ignavibacteria bacterium]